MFFGLIAILPTVIIAMFTAVFFELGLKNWFSDNVRSTVDNSVSVAEDYFDEHKRLMQRDLAETAAALNRNASKLQFDNEAMMEEVISQAHLHLLAEVVVLSSKGVVYIRYSSALSGDSPAAPTKTLPRRSLQDALPGVIVPIPSTSDDRVQAVIKLDAFFDRYLFASRVIDPAVIEKLNSTREQAAQYNQLEEDRSAIQQRFNFIFMAIAFLILLAAIGAGLWLATQMVAPINRLANAAEKVRQGDLTVRVEEGESDDEIGFLSRAFNRMTSQLESQRKDLIEANEQLDHRRRFTEAVLAGVSVGVVGLDAEGRVDLPNREAMSILEISEVELNGQILGDAAPELRDLLALAANSDDNLVEKQINIIRAGAPKNLLVRIATERVGQDVIGYVVTLDDITNLVAAERTAAWADVARRIAHEIKNPLTPIQLSAERLNRRYKDEVQSDPEIFSQCTDTIIRQVGDIRRMVDEFSGFARMPAPTFGDEEIIEIIRQTTLFLEVSSPQVQFKLNLPKAPLMIYCDGRLLAQALTNIIQNAVEAIGSTAGGNTASRDAKIEISVETRDEKTIIKVSDNGCGLPAELRDRLTEPYVTTRAKGTGLGLAIVRKIMSDHGGELVIEDGPSNGAVVKLVFSNERLDELRASQDAVGRDVSLSVTSIG